MAEFFLFAISFFFFPFSVGPGNFQSTTSAGVPAASSTLSNPVVAAVGGQTTSAFDEILKATPPALVAFLANLPIIEGKLRNLSFS